MSLDEKLELASKIIKEGGVVICPTEGLYGISCSIYNEQAIKRIIELKKRASNKGLIVASDTIERISEHIDFKKITKEQQQKYLSKWPGFITLVLPCKNLNPLLTGNRDTQAFRVTAFPLFSKLIALSQCPIVSTSANISGCEPLRSISQLKEVFSDKVDYILDESCQGLNKPSEIYDCIKDLRLR